MFAWYWLSDLCNREGIKFVLGHALYMKAVHGGKAKNDKIDSHKLAVLLRGGSFPVRPMPIPEMRATRDLMRRRNHLVHERAELLAHIQNTAIHYNLPEIAVDLTSECNRKEVDEHFPDMQVRKIVQVDLAMINAYDYVINVLERDIEKTARRHDGHALMLLRSVRGIGGILGLVLLYEIHNIRRFETVQDFASYCRMVKCSPQSANKKKGTGGAKDRQRPSEVDVLRSGGAFVRHNPSAKNRLMIWVKVHGKEKALAILAHKLARAIYYTAKREHAVIAAVQLYGNLIAVSVGAWHSNVASTLEPLPRCSRTGRSLQTGQGDVLLLEDL